MSRLRGTWLLSMLVCVGSPVLAQEPIALDDNVSWSAEAQRVEIPADLERATRNGAEPVDAVAIALLRSIRYVIDVDTIEKHVTEVTHYLKPEGADEYGNVPIWFDASSDSVDVRRAAVVDVAGNVRVVDPATVQILPRDTEDVFSDAHYVLVPLTGLETGATAIVSTVTTTRRRDRIDPWAGLVYQEMSIPQQRLELRVEWSDEALEPVWRSEFSGMDCSRLGTLAVECIARDVRAYLQDADVYYRDVVPQFVVAEKRAWDDVQRWFANLFGSSLSGGEVIEAMARRLTEAAESDVEKVRSIHEFVARDVRYVGLEHERNAYAPHATALTLERRYGDCKDKTALLIDLLRQVGIEMSPVLVATERRDPGALGLPSSIYFDHLVACGVLDDGSRYCADSTDAYSGIDVLGAYVQGAVALPISGDAEPGTLPADPYRWRFREELGLTISDEGNVTEKSRVHYAGAYGSNIRRALAAMNGDERQQWAVRDYQNTISTLVEPEFAFSGIDAINDDLVIEWQTEFENLVTTEGDLSYGEDTGWLDQILGGLTTDNKHHAYRFTGLSYEGRTTIDVGRRWRLKWTGPEVDIVSNFGTFTRRYETVGSTVTVFTRVALPAAVIGLDKMGDFNRFVEILDAENTLRIEAENRAEP